MEHFELGHVEGWGGRQVRLGGLRLHNVRPHQADELAAHVGVLVLEFRELFAQLREHPRRVDLVLLESGLALEVLEFIGFDVAALLPLNEDQVLSELNGRSYKLPRAKLSFRNSSSLSLSLCFTFLKLYMLS